MRSIIGAIFGLTTIAGGILASVVGFAAEGVGSASPWLQTGGTAAAVGGLAYVAKLLADGKLVANPVAELIRDQKELGAKLADLAQESHAREERLWGLVKRGPNE